MSQPYSPRWFAQINGHEFDLLDGEQFLRLPFDPWCERISRGDGTSIWALCSRTFGYLNDANEVRDKAVQLLQQVNGALAVDAQAEPLSFVGVGRVDDRGRVSVTIFAEGHARARSRAIAVGGAIDAIGNFVPPPPPTPSTAQRWITAADRDADIKDLLVYAGRADNWFDIYKTLEVAKKLAGNQKKLENLLGKFV